MKLSILKACGAALLLAAATSIGSAAIEKLDLPKMMSRVDNAVQGKIIDRQVFRADHNEDGRMYYTVVTVQGTSLVDGSEIQVPVTFLGGVLNQNEGTQISEMPRDSVTKVGREVVVFYKWADNLGYGISGNAMYAAQGGVFQVANKGAKKVVLGKGKGFAIEANVEMPQLQTRVKGIVAELKQIKQTK